jgi:hypothetical protein
VRKFVLDTNLFIAADRSPPGGEALGRFYDRHLPATFMHAVVIQELLLGGTTADRRERLRRDLIRPLRAGASAGHAIDACLDPERGGSRGDGRAWCTLARRLLPLLPERRAPRRLPAGRRG